MTKNYALLAGAAMVAVLLVMTGCTNEKPAGQKAKPAMALSDEQAGEPSISPEQKGQTMRIPDEPKPEAMDSRKTTASGMLLDEPDMKSTHKAATPAQGVKSPMPVEPKP